MKSTLVAVALTLLLVAAGAVSWALGRAHERAAEMKENVATLQFDAVADDEGPAPDEWMSNPARVPVVGAAIAKEDRTDRATVAYWLGRYDALAPERDLTGTVLERDPELLFHAANATFRASQFDVTDREAAVQRMEVILRSYAEVLTTSPEMVDAAYNYEFAARLTRALEQGRPGAVMVANMKKNQPSIHGVAGETPSTEDDSGINVIVPKQGDERVVAPEAGKGTPRIRKG
jgi:hypothetical protein